MVAILLKILKIYTASTANSPKGVGSMMIEGWISASNELNHKIIFCEYILINMFAGRMLCIIRLKAKEFLGFCI